MSRSKIPNFTGWTVPDLVAYAGQCALALDEVTKPAARKKLHAELAAIAKELAARLTQRTSILYTPRLAG